MTPFGKNLHTLLLDRSISQKDLAVRVHLAPSQVSQLISGKSGPPSLQLIERISVVLGLSSAETAQLQTAATLSARRFEVDENAPAWIYEIANEFHRRVKSLSQTQAKALRATLEAFGEGAGGG